MRLLIALLVCMALSGCADLFVNGMRAEEQHNFSLALSSFVKGAERGDPLCQYKAGEYFFAGKGVDRDPLKAVRYFRESAKQKFESAQLRLPMIMATYIKEAQIANQPIAPDVSLEEALAWAFVAEKSGMNMTNAKLLISRDLGPDRINDARPLIEEFSKKYVIRRP